VEKVLSRRLPLGDRRAEVPLAYQAWPVFDPALLVEETIELPFR